MTTLDLPLVEAIAAAVHPQFPESPLVFAERLRLYPDGARLLEQGGRAAGYLVSHPWRSGELPALDTLLGAIPPRSDTFYLHDLALLAQARGTGAAAAVVDDLVRHARNSGFATMTLVAVNGSLPFWSRHGFVVAKSGALEDKLRSYEDAARLMVKELR